MTFAEQMRDTFDKLAAVAFPVIAAKIEEAVRRQESLTLTYGELAILRTNLNRTLPMSIAHINEHHGGDPIAKCKCAEAWIAEKKKEMGL